MSLLLSIITINLNNHIGLEKTIISVINQKGINYEYIIIDGGSTDDSISVIERHADNITYWVSEKDTGIYAAMNKGIDKATGNYLMFLNSGDSLTDSTVLKQCYKRIYKGVDADILYGYVSAVRTLLTKELWKFPALLSIDYFEANTINHQAAFIKASLFTEFGRYREEYKLAADYAFFLKCLLADKKFMAIDAVIVDYDLNGISSENGFRAAELERQIIWRELVPLWAQQLVREHTELVRATSPKLVRLATFANKIISKYLR